MTETRQPRHGFAGVTARALTTIQRYAGRWRRLTSPLDRDIGEVRLMTYNTHHGAGPDDRLDLEAIARTIESCRPDVVALQEVDRHWGPRSDWADQAAWYAQRLGMHVFFAANLTEDPPEPGRPVREYGLAVLSTTPLSRTDHQLFLAASAEPRGVAAVVVDSAVGPLHLATTHLAVESSTARRSQVAELIRRLDRADAMPTVVCGDFNDRAGALTGLRPRLRDAWWAGTGRASTCGRRRIDHVWLSADLHPVRAFVVASDASDHLPLVVDVIVR